MRCDQQQASLQEVRKANVPADVDRTKATFRVGDACNLPQNLAPADAILAANLLCRLPEPRRFLDRLPDLVKRGGVVVFTTPFSWLEAWTRKSRWLGGCAHHIAALATPVVSLCMQRSPGPARIYACIYACMRQQAYWFTCRPPWHLEQSMHVCTCA